MSAGFPSNSCESTEAPLDLNRLLIHHPAATFYVRVNGHSMCEAGIFDGDLLIVDRSLDPKDGDIVIAAVASELTVKRLRLEKGRARLEAANAHFAAIDLGEFDDLTIWGVVSHSIRELRHFSKSSTDTFNGAKLDECERPYKRGR